MEIIIRDRTKQTGNVHVAIHPLRTSGNTWMSIYKGHYGSQDIFADEENKMPLWLRKMADDLWEAVPGLNTLSIGNGEITLQHVGIFEDREVIAYAEPVIRHHIELNERLLQVLKEN